MGKLTIEDAQAIARKRNGQCLSEVYINSTTYLKWRCEYGHEWNAPLNSVKNGGSWCPDCAGKKSCNIEVARKIAIERGGQCLSEVYINSTTYLKWRCEYGHEWNSSLSSVKNAQSWCPDCAGNKRFNIEVAQRVAIERNGLCLSETYVNHTTHLRWRCNRGHEWEATLNNVKNKESWCPDCAGVKPLDLKAAQEIAIERGGICLSETYINCRTHLRWRCANGHEWQAHLSNIKSGEWCADC